jgi:alkylation response protein AidB-like acyl-CoA dehydrogenase
MDRSIFDHEHQLFRESVQGFVRQHVAPNLDRFRTQRLIDRAVWLQAGRQGLLGVQVPEEYGGTGVADQRFIVVLCEELARVSLALASCVGIHVDVTAPYLLELATAEQRERWFAPFCSGELVTAIGMTEPAAGSDLAALRTRARRAGDRWILNGSKTFITNGTCADLVIVAALTGDNRREITLFGVEATTPGFTRGAKLEKVGQHEADTAELSFSDIELSHDDVIGEVGAGWGHMLARLPRERLHTAYVSLAHAEATFDATLEYVTTREAFGQPIGTFQHSRFQLADARANLDVARAYVDRCIETQVAGHLSDVDAAQAKYFVTEIQNRIIDCCVQLHGGYGYMQESAVARAWADARVTRIYGGTNEIMKEIIARSLGLREQQ